MAIIIGMSINKDKTVVIANNDQTESVVTDNAKNEAENNNSEQIKEEEKVDTSTNTQVPTSKQINLTVLGEMMMGGSVTTKVDYLYSSSFRNIFTHTRTSDFTYSTLSTNITSLDKIEDAKSEYLVTKDIKNAITALGIDAVNIASDHMADFPDSIFKNTIDILHENNTNVAGLNDSILYLEKNGKKIAIVAANNVFIGTKYNYKSYGINVYNEEKMKSDILEASENADFVIADIHWGREFIYGVTQEMKNIAYSAVNSGADLVMGSHALGIYPVITYKNVPIIYSTGYLMTDSESELAKQSYIFDININEENKVKTIEMLPIYINNKSEVLLYHEYNRELANNFNIQMNTWHEDNSLNSKIVDNKIVINF